MHSLRLLDDRKQLRDSKRALTVNALTPVAKAAGRQPSELA
jgi:hypothetical protein